MFTHDAKDTSYVVRCATCKILYDVPGGDARGLQCPSCRRELQSVWADELVTT